MKIAGRVAVFVLGLSLLFFAWRKAHHDPAATPTPTGGNSSAPAVLVVFGGFLALMAFLPSSSTLSRWTTPPKPAKASKPAHFRGKRRS